MLTSTQLYTLRNKDILTKAKEDQKNVLKVITHLIGKNLLYLVLKKKNIFFLSMFLNEH